MVRGFEGFKAWFSGYEDQYTIIGGTACDLLMAEEGYDFRATKDLDIVLIVEFFTAEFGERFWKYIQTGEYQYRNKSTGKLQFYRFSNPTHSEYPAMIELFSRRLETIKLSDDATITPFPIDEEISSLSAILLDDEYYGFLRSGKILLAGIPILDAGYLIPFKAKAWIDLTRRQAQGEHVDTKNIRKHQNDIFRLLMLLTPETKIPLPLGIKDDIVQFLNAMESTDINIKNLGIKTRTKQEMLHLLDNIYIKE